MVKGQKIGIKTSPRNHNIMAEFDLKNHFLKKLDELRVMREEYYRAPEEPALDPVEILKQKYAQEDQAKKLRQAGTVESPWQVNENADEDENTSPYKTMNSDDDNRLDSPAGEPGLTTSVLLQYYSRNELGQGSS